MKRSELKQIIHEVLDSQYRVGDRVEATITGEVITTGVGGHFLRIKTNDGEVIVVDSDNVRKLEF